MRARLSLPGYIILIVSLIYMGAVISILHWAHAFVPIAFCLQRWRITLLHYMDILLQEICAHYM